MNDQLAAPPRGEPDWRGEGSPEEPSLRYEAPDDRMVDAIEDRSLLEDLEALYHDGRTYASAELAFQKTRASFAADRAKKGLVFGAIGAGAALLAAIGLTVGLILTLATLVGPLLATIIVVAALLIVAWLCVSRATSRFGELSRAFASNGENRT